jgi:hypothetical protein
VDFESDNLKIIFFLDESKRILSITSIKTLLLVFFGEVLDKE